MINSENIDCVGLQREIRDQMAEEASFDIRKLVEKVYENTKDDKIIQQYYQRKNKESQQNAA